MAAAVSPDGTKLAYGTREGTDLMLNLIELESGEKRQLKVGGDAPLPNDVNKTIRPAIMPYLAWASNQRILYKPDAYALNSVGTDLGEPVELVQNDAEGGLTAQVKFESIRSVKAIVPSEPDWVLVETANRASSTSTVRTVISTAPRQGIGILSEGGGQSNISYNTLRTVWANVLSGKTKHPVNDKLEYKTAVAASGAIRAEYRSINMKSSELYLFDENGEKTFSLNDAINKQGLAIEGFKFDRKAGPARPNVTLQNFGHHKDWLFFSSALGKNTRGLYSLNISTFQEPTLIFEDERFDVDYKGEYFDESTLMHCDPTGSPAGIRYEAEKQTTVWLEPHIDQAQKAIDKLLPGAVNEVTSWSDALDVFTVASKWKDSPYSLYVYFAETGSLKRVADNGPLGVVTVPVWIPAAGGSQLLSYLSLPQNAKAGVPNRTIVLFASDPLTRVTYDLPDEARLLAESGYTILRVNTRGTPGFGSAHFEAGAKQLGIAAAEDLQAVLDWCIARKISAKGDVFTMGSGLGGWLALNVAVRDPEMYKGVVAISPITELARFIKERNLEEEPELDVYTRRFINEMLGNPKTDKKTIAAQSPIQFADDLACPVLLVHGFDDSIVLPHHSENLFNKLKKHSAKSRLLIVKDQGKDSWGDGTWGPEQLQEIYGTVLEFLSQ